MLRMLIEVLSRISKIAVFEKSVQGQTKCEWRNLLGPTLHIYIPELQL